ncbi:hypothetical protein SRHO_G00126630 [Serrasalmus rhombeus]
MGVNELHSAGAGDSAQRLQKPCSGSAEDTAAPLPDANQAGLTTTTFFTDVSDLDSAASLLDNGIRA